MQKINVTEPFLPPLEEYIEYLKGIWDRNWLTNQGPLVREFEERLQGYHDLNLRVNCVANGSLGLQIALTALGIQGQIITTPFSYVATITCPLWEGCTVKFADIEPDTLTINPKAVEAAITPKTEAILATHVFGNPCDVEALETIAKKCGLALIYDAAHAFGVTYKGKSLLEYGDVSMVSLHATKLLHSVEGGFVVAKDAQVAEKVEWMRRFGHKGFEAFHGIGINAKMSEMHAAMGLCNLNHIDTILAKRKAICEAYDQALFYKSSQNSENSDPSLVLRTPAHRDRASRNYAYYPVVFQSETELLAAIARLNSNEIYPRRYFYPSLHQVPQWLTQDAECAVSADISGRILCLPLSTEMDPDITKVVGSEIMKSKKPGL